MPELSEKKTKWALVRGIKVISEMNSLEMKLTYQWELGTYSAQAAGQGPDPPHFCASHAFFAYEFSEPFSKWVKVTTARVIKFFSSESSWTPKTQPNDALRRRLVEFLVFNSAFGSWR